MLPTVTILGNPEDDALRHSAAAMREAGLTVEVLAHRDLIRNPGLLEDAPDDSRAIWLEPLGNDGEMLRELLRLGHRRARYAEVPLRDPDRPIEDGEFVPPRQLHFGYEAYLLGLHRLISDKTSWRSFHPIPDLLELFDGEQSHTRYSDSGLPTTDHLDSFSTTTSLRECLEEHGVSSAAIEFTCVSQPYGALRYSTESGREVLTTSIVPEAGGWRVGSELRGVTSPEEVEQILRFVAANGARAVRWSPRAEFQGERFDLRALVVAGEVLFPTLRTSPTGYTSLRWGGTEGDLEGFAEDHGDALETACALAFGAAQLHDVFQVEVDVLIEPGFSGAKICGSGAFGDRGSHLLADDRTVFQWQAQHLAERLKRPA